MIMLVLAARERKNDDGFSSLYTSLIIVISPRNDIKVQLVFIRFQIKISRPFKKCRFLVSRWSCLLLSGLIGTPACLSNNLSWQIRVTIHTQTKFSMWIILSSSQKSCLKFRNLCKTASNVELNLSIMALSCAKCKKNFIVLNQLSKIRPSSWVQSCHCIFLSRLEVIPVLP